MMTLEGCSKSFFTKLLIWHVQLIGIYSRTRISLCLVRKVKEKLEVLPRLLDDEIRSSQLGVSLRGGTCGNLGGTANSFWNIMVI